LADFIKVCVELDPDQRVSVDKLLNHHFFEEISQKSSKRSRKNYFSPYKSRKNLQYLSNSPAFGRKVSPSKENEAVNKIREEGYRKFHEKLPNIKQVIETRKKVVLDVSKIRYGAKSTLKGGYLEKEQMKKKYSLLPNQSNESLVKFSFHNQSTSIRNRPTYDNGIGYSGSSSKNFSKKNVSKLDLSFLSKNMGVSGMFYASSRK
jgi:serine/threonine protein kinase